MNFWPFSKKPKLGPSDQSELPEGVVLAGDADTPPPEKPFSNESDDTAQPIEQDTEVSALGTETITYAPPRDIPLSLLSQQEESVPSSSEELPLSWAADLLKEEEPLESAIHPEVSLSELSTAASSMNQALANTLQKAMGHESLFQKPAILITDNLEMDQNNPPTETESSLDSINRISEDDHNTTMDYLFDAEGNTPKDFWAHPPSSAAGIESGLFSPLEAITPTFTDSLPPQTNDTLWQSEPDNRQNQDLPTLPDLSDILNSSTESQTYSATEPIDPVESDLASLALYLSGSPEIEKHPELAPEAIMPDKTLEAAPPESSISNSLYTEALSKSPDDLESLEYKIDAEAPTTDPLTDSQIWTPDPLWSETSPTETNTSGEDLESIHQYEVQTETLSEEVESFPLEENNYGPLPVYAESMADELEKFGRKVILQDTQFLKNSIDHLVDSYFSSKDND